MQGLEGSNGNLFLINSPQAGFKGSIINIDGDTWSGKAWTWLYSLDLLDHPGRIRGKGVQGRLGIQIHHILYLSFIPLKIGTIYTALDRISEERFLELVDEFDK